jgi:hypothetical protein
VSFTVLDLDPRSSADVLVVGTFIGVLKAAPAAHVIDQDGRKIRIPILDVTDETLEGVSAVQSQAAFTFVGVGPNDL